MGWEGGRSAIADVLVLGGGLAGHFLARELARSPWSAQSGGRSIVVVDSGGARLDGRRWAYWSEAAEPDAWRGWGRLHVHLQGRDLRLELRRHRYWQVRGEDLDAACRREWGPRVAVVQARALAIDDSGPCVVVSTDRGDLRARWVLDGVLAPLRPAAASLWFSGSEVCVPGTLDTGAATLIDDRLGDARHGDGFGFAYLLPTGPGVALVEATRFARACPADLDADRLAFTRERLPGAVDGGWAESGRLALAPPPRRRRLSRRVLTIGTPGGGVRASTGYGLTRIRADAVDIARSLERHGHPFAAGRMLPRRHAWADSVLLDVMAADPEAVHDVFLALFSRVDPDVVLDFLDGTTSLRREREVIRALPQEPLRRAASARWGWSGSPGSPRSGSTAGRPWRKPWK